MCRSLQRLSIEHRGGDPLDLDRADVIAATDGITQLRTRSTDGVHEAGDSEGFYAECMIDDMIGRLYSLVIDCPDPRALAVFYEQLLGMRRRYDKADWVAIGADGDSPEVNFQRIDDYQSPRWPDPGHPARLHVDVMVDDLDVAEAKVLALGATLLEGSDKPIGYRVYADPIGHPFCLITPESVPTHA